MQKVSEDRATKILDRLQRVIPQVRIGITQEYHLNVTLVVLELLTLSIYWATVFLVWSVLTNLSTSIASSCSGYPIVVLLQNTAVSRALSTTLRYCHLNNANELLGLILVVMSPPLVSRLLLLCHRLTNTRPVIRAQATNAVSSIDSPVLNEAEDEGAFCLARRFRGHAAGIDPSGPQLLITLPFPYFYRSSTLCHTLDSYQSTDEAPGAPQLR